MPSIQVTCDRCGELVDGLEIEGQGTAGFYRTGPGSFWQRYANPGELIICDGCMHANPRYIADYMDAANEDNATYLSKRHKT